MVSMPMVNECIEWDQNASEPRRLVRVLYVNPETDMVVVIDLLNNKMPEQWKLSGILYEVEVGIARITSVIPSRLYLSEEELPIKHKLKRDEAWNHIKDMVSQANEPDIYDDQLRGNLINEIFELTGKSKNLLRGYLKRYWRGGKVVNALLPDYQNSGAKGKRRKGNGKKNGRRSLRVIENSDKEGIVVTEEIKQIFSISIAQWYRTRNEMPLSMVYQRMIERYFYDGYEKSHGVLVPVLLPPEKRPTLRQFRYWFENERDIKTDYEKRKGSRKVNLSHREVLGTIKGESFGPGSVYQIDATIGDIYLVHRINRKWIIGRPIIYFVMDVFSRLVAGLYVGLEGPSWIGAMMALENAASDKVSYCERFGIKIDREEWPAHHLPEILTADRGELVSEKANNLINGLGVDVQNLPPYRPDWKPVVEQSFHLENIRTIKWLPGAVQERIRERGERDYRLDAMLDLFEFEKILIHSVLYHNNQHYLQSYERDEFMVGDDVVPIPVNIWNWGITNRIGKLKSVPKDILRLNLLPSQKVKVTQHGISFHNMSYTCETAVKEQWFFKARNQRNKHEVELCYDPRDTSVTYLRLDGGRRYEVCHMIDPTSRYFGKRMEEVIDLNAYESYLRKEGKATISQQGMAELNAQIESIVSTATEKTKAALQEEDISNNQRIESIREHRALEKLDNRDQEKFILGEDTSETRRAQIIHINRNQKETGYIPQPDESNFIDSLLNDDDDM